MSDSDDAKVLRQVREAEAAMAERPSPRVRQAVLRAAAEAVGRDARSVGRGPSAAQAERPAPGWLPRSWRWSVPVAASVLVGAVAFSIVSQVQRTAGPTVVASAVLEENKPAAPAPAPLEQAQSEAPAAPAAGAAVANYSKTKESAPKAKSEMQVVAQNAPLGAPAVPPPAPAETPAPQPRAEPSDEALKKVAGTVRARQRAEQAAGDRESGRLDTLEASAPAPATPTAAADAAAVTAPMSAARSAPALAKAVDFHQTPRQWIEHIVALRRDGRQDEADRELAQLRKRYPEFVIPAAALRPPG